MISRMLTAQNSPSYELMKNYSAWVPVAYPTGMTVNSTMSGVFGNGIFIVLKGDYVATSTYCTSKDGVTWTLYNSPTGVNTSLWHSISFVNNQFVMFGYNKIATSTDGITWSVVACNLFNVSYKQNIQYINGVYIIAKASNAGNEYLFTSPNLTTWTQKSYTHKAATATGDGKVICLQAGGAAAKSNSGLITTDGTTFSTITLPLVRDYVKVVFNPIMKKFFAISYIKSEPDGLLTDGSTFTVTSLPSSTINFSDLAYGNRFFCIIPNGDNMAYISMDGVNWLYKNLPSITNWQRVISGNNRFVTFTNSFAGGMAVLRNPTPYRFYRLYGNSYSINNNTSNFTFSLFTVSMYTTANATGTDVCLNKPTFASTDYSTDYASGAANDGNTGSRWSSETPGTPNPWWAVDLGNFTNVRSISLNPNATDIPKIVILQGSFDRNVWEDVTTFYPSSSGATITLTDIQ
jgi:hypothetical protein